MKGYGLEPTYIACNKIEGLQPLRKCGGSRVPLGLGETLQPLADYFQFLCTMEAGQSSTTLNFAVFDKYVGSPINPSESYINDANH